MVDKSISMEAGPSQAGDHDESDEELEQNEAWDDWRSDDDGESEPGLICLFCDSTYESSETLFDHCRSDHSFDFLSIRRVLGLDFYASFRLINFIRSQVADCKCWRCGLVFNCKTDLQNHFHETDVFEKEGKFPWENDMYLKPFLVDDALLHSFAGNEDEDDDPVSVDKEELMRELMSSGVLEEIRVDSELITEINSSDLDVCEKNGVQEGPCVDGNASKCSERILTKDSVGDLVIPPQKQKDKQLRVSFANVAAKEIKTVNEDYFGAYGSFGIHRVMLSDKPRMDAYRGALLNNPSLMNKATVMDVGCGTGILSLFAAQAGASKVIAVEASAKMAGLATQIAKDNCLLKEGDQDSQEKASSGVITVAHCMVEELNNCIQVKPHSIDVLISEWMGYCLLYESMLTSVLYARDHWLKPGGAILPDTATIFAAGFGKGGTSLPFWEDVYGFNMSCIGNEAVEDATQVPIVDVIETQDIITESAVVQAFDLTTMNSDEMDFTSNFELNLKSVCQADGSARRWRLYSPHLLILLGLIGPRLSSHSKNQLQWNLLVLLLNSLNLLP
ncbi:probable protein arginine N-methyltransferase 3 isoform X3 [Dioscorea cayenensis subsp. rotundata]|uniref:Probable protein arginine N-methyltransferase 3 isoform X3 n=1 Tax=Dioscorea cayennensis subsp. rotundata TaxID=55577 RepID=A0AB40BYS2_DIOCR|nr:probable protein arginine N-methyltransferase 3 isoform X3 [Dioscorea cayenensis subsp. rotundata]